MQPEPLAKVKYNLISSFLIFFHFLFLRCLIALWKWWASVCTNNLTTHFTNPFQYCSTGCTDTCIANISNNNKSILEFLKKTLVSWCLSSFYYNFHIKYFIIFRTHLTVVKYCDFPALKKALTNTFKLHGKKFPTTAVCFLATSFPFTACSPTTIVPQPICGQYFAQPHFLTIAFNYCIASII